jgi:5'-nucleotidase
MPFHVTGRLASAGRDVNGWPVAAYAVDASPAQAVNHGVIELAPRPPALVVSGINPGANLGTDTTVSGTVGAALEASAFNIPALAMSVEIRRGHGSDPVDYSTAILFTRQFASQLIAHGLPSGVDAVSVNVPASANPNTPWRLTRLCRRRHFRILPPDRNKGEGRLRFVEDITQAEPDSDVWAVKVDRLVSLTPLSLDLTARVDCDAIASVLGAEQAVSVDAPVPPSFALAYPWGFARDHRPVTLPGQSEESDPLRTAD